MKITTTLGLVLLSLVAPAKLSQAAVIVQYRLGENGTMSSGSNLPIDSSGNGYNITNGADTFTNVVVAPGTGGAPGSTAALNFAGTGYYYANANGTINPGANWTVDLWAKPTSFSISNNTMLFGTNGANANGLQFNISGGMWQAAYGGGSARTGATAVADIWTQLTVTSIGGNSTFYINGVAQGATFTTPVSINWSIPVLAVTGTNNYRGALDEITISTAIPEPGTLALFSAALTMALVFRRRAIRS